MVTRFFSLVFLICYSLTVCVLGNDKDGNKDLSSIYKIHAEMLMGMGAKCKEKGMESQKLSYSESKAGITYQHPFTAERNLLLGLNYYLIDLKWKDSPNFDNRSFHKVGFKLGGQIKEIDKWNLNASIEAIMSTAKFGLNDYSVYEGALWGRYAYSSVLGFYIGVYGKVGLRKETVLPVLGFDYLGFKSLKLFFIFPVKMTAIYFFDKKWSFSISGRFFRTRNKMPDKGKNPKNIFYYRSVGAEGEIKYSHNKKFSARLFAGSNFGSNLKVKDSGGTNTRNYAFKPAPYFGFGANINL